MVGRSGGEERSDCAEESEEDGCETWTESLEELGDMTDAFAACEQRRKTILDVGTSGIKPLYIALKYEPHKIIGITLDKPRFASDIAENSRLLTKTEIHFYTCDFFDDVCLDKILQKANVVGRFDLILISKTLHHLRNGECIADKRGSKHKCRKDEKSCIYRFDEEEIFKRFFKYGKKVIVYEWAFPDEMDIDKQRGKGGHFTREEWSQMLDHLERDYSVEVFKPIRRHLDGRSLGEVKKKLKEVDCICFSVEKE